MQIQTHILSGWCVADLLKLTPRERLFAMIAASAADLDGLGLLVSIDCYVQYHHVVAHNLLFGSLLSAALAAFCTHRAKAFVLFLGLFHLHLLLDFQGSGPGWGIFYLWPFSRREFLNAQPWDFNSWQNMTAAVSLLLWSVLIALKRQRTPLERLMPSLEKKLVRRLKKLTARA